MIARMRNILRTNTEYRPATADTNTSNARIAYMPTSAAPATTAISRAVRNARRRRHRMKTIHDYIAVIIGTLHNASEVAFAQAVMAIEMLYEGRC